MRPGVGPRLLVSARDADEAAIALAGGADVIDLKEPARGALGAVDAATLRAAVAIVGGRRPVSATTGDMPPDDPDAVIAAARAVAATGVDFVKIGLFPGAGRGELIVRLGGEVCGEARLVGVMFADSGFDPALLPALAAAGFAGVVIDTADKRAGRLVDHLPVVELGSLVAAARAHGMFCGLAGSLRREDLPRLAALDPDLIGVRGAASAGSDRTAGLEAARVAALVADLTAWRAGRPYAA
jgi:uncharacterized protein (UPF0264 family)